MAVQAGQVVDQGALTSQGFAITVDVEPDWGISGCASVQSVLPRLCERLAAHNVRATFFITAGMLEECGATLRRYLVGHEVASHGLSHRRMDGLTEIDALAEMRDSRLRLEDFFSKEVRGFRAPYLRPTPGDWWRLLRQAGYAYDSSVGSLFPSRRNVYAGCWEMEAHEGIIELPMTALRGGWAPFNLAALRLMHPLGVRLMHPQARLFSMRLRELAGKRAWKLLEQVLENYGTRAMTCWEMAKQAAGSR